MSKPTHECFVIKKSQNNRKKRTDKSFLLPSAFVPLNFTETYQFKTNLFYRDENPQNILVQHTLNISTPPLSIWVRPAVLWLKAPGFLTCQLVAESPHSQHPHPQRDDKQLANMWRWCPPPKAAPVCVCLYNDDWDSHSSNMQTRQRHLRCFKQTDCVRCLVARLKPLCWITVFKKRCCVGGWYGKDRRILYIFLAKWGHLG